MLWNKNAWGGIISNLFFLDKKDVYSKGYFMNIHIHVYSCYVMLCELHMVHKIVGYWGMWTISRNLFNESGGENKQEKLPPATEQHNLGSIGSSLQIFGDSLLLRKQIGND